MHLEENFTPLGQRVLFNPNAALGVRLTDRWAIEAAWTHISNGGLAHPNPGMDDFGARVVFHFGPMSR